MEQANVESDQEDFLLFVIFWQDQQNLNKIQKADPITGDKKNENREQNPPNINCNPKDQKQNDQDPVNQDHNWNQYNQNWDQDQNNQNQNWDQDQNNQNQNWDQNNQNQNWDQNNQDQNAAGWSDQNAAGWIDQNVVDANQVYTHFHSLLLPIIWTDGQIVQF